MCPASVSARGFGIQDCPPHLIGSLLHYFRLPQKEFGLRALTAMAKWLAMCRSSMTFSSRERIAPQSLSSVDPVSSASKLAIEKACPVWHRNRG